MEAEEVPYMPPRWAEDAEEVPYMPPRPSTAAPSGTWQQSEDAEEVPYVPPVGANTAEDETPCLDSLPSTPRAVSGERETATPCGAAPMEDDRPPAEQGNVAETGVPERAAAERVAAAVHPPGAAVQPASAAEPSAGAAQPPGSGGTN